MASISGAGAASYDRIAPSQPAAPAPAVGPAGSVEIDLTGGGGDTVEISEPSSGAPGTYAPPAFEDRFRYDLQNGLVDPERRFSPLNNRYFGFAAAGYEERGSVAVQVTRVSGIGSSTSALFQIQYGDATPDPADATTEVDAFSKYTRIADRSLELLNSL